jgi:hypothetical protein
LSKGSALYLAELVSVAILVIPTDELLHEEMAPHTKLQN